MVKKKNKKVKPGYKKKINQAISHNEKKKRQLERRQTNRANRKARKEEY
jgi:ATP-dependent RNA helicase CshB